MERGDEGNKHVFSKLTSINRRVPLSSTRLLLSGFIGKQPKSMMVRTSCRLTLR